MTERRKVNVTIDGRNFAIIGNEEEEYIEELAYYVDKKIRNLTAKNDKLSQTMSATLAALHIADELYKTREDYDLLEKKAKDPLEKYDLVCDRLKSAETKIEGYEKVLSQYQETILEDKTHREKLLNKIRNLEKDIESKEEVIEGLEEKVRGLQDKNFENQLELIDVKKELTEYLGLLEAETSID